MGDKEKKSAGNLSKMHLDLTKPMEMKHIDLELNQLSVFVGQNGTGKTLILINAWIMGFVASSLVFKKPDKEELIGICQFSYDHCFTDNNFTGTVGCTYQSGATLSITLNEGKVTDVTHTGFENIDQAGDVQFMSSAMRTFEAIGLYLKMRKMVMEQPGMNEALVVLKMIENYKLYDVLYIEKLIRKMPLTVTPTMKESLEKFDVKDDITLFNVDLVKGDFYHETKGEVDKKYLSKYGKGHQSIFNMMLGNS